MNTLLTRISILTFVLLVSIALSWCGKQKIDAESYTSPTIEEFYSDIESLWIQTSPEAKTLSQEFRDEVLQQVLMSHESHLDGFTTKEMQEIAYSKVTEKIIAASN